MSDIYSDFSAFRNRAALFYAPVLLFSDSLLITTPIPSLMGKDNYWEPMDENKKKDLK